MDLYLTGSLHGNHRTRRALVAAGVDRWVAPFAPLRAGSPCDVAMYAYALGAGGCMLDASGALDTAALDAYAARCRADAPRLVAYTAPTPAALDAMERAGLAPAPLFRPGDDLGWLAELRDRAALVVLAPSALVRRRREASAWLDACWRVLAARRGAAVHGARVFSPAAWCRYPWRSVDTTTPLYAAGRGIALRFDASGPALAQDWHLWQRDDTRYLAGRGGDAIARRLRHNVSVACDAARYATDLWRARAASNPSNAPP